jgi:hypothetical protein
MYFKIYTEQSNIWLTRILDFPKPMDVKERRKLGDYLIARVRASDKQAQLGRQKNSQKILEEYLGLTDAMKARERYDDTLARIIRSEIMLDFQELARS